MGFLRVLMLGFALLLTSGCVKLTIAWADLSAQGPIAAPAALDGFGAAGPVTRAEDWTTDRAPILRQAFQDHIYGVLPEASSTELIESRVLDAAAFDGAGRLEEYVLRSTLTFNGVTQKTPRYVMNVLYPNNRTGPVPVILKQSFCPRWSTIPHQAVARPEGARSCDGLFFSIARSVFGRYIATPPLETILQRGYAFATIYPSEIVPDNGAGGLEALANLSVGHEDEATRWGAIAAWGWAYSRMADILLADERIDDAGLVAYGHSRYGKAALLAAAYDERIGGVIAHQSGTGGASLNRLKKGESIQEITDSFPHWFSKTYAGYAGQEETMPVDQHQLIALVAPRPVLLGNARRDVWSDPNGAFRAALGASPVYELFGDKGLMQERGDVFKPSARLSYWMRPGTHGVVKEDWPAFLAFLDAHFMERAE